MINLRAIMVCVDYADLLAVTLPLNRHHFSEVCIVTSHGDKETQRIASEYRCSLHLTETFYAKGAAFNKWAALEEALDVFGRMGWLCIMDADVVWPIKAPLSPKIGELWTPLRRMAPWPINYLPSETTWHLYALHRNTTEWAGYSQIFHAEDPHLPKAPWHEIDWTHAGGADSLFQRHWPMNQKRRPDWECLHLGEPGQNWYGRATPMADGSVPTDAMEKRGKIAQIWEGRRAIRKAGGGEAEAFAPEKLG